MPRIKQATKKGYIECMINGVADLSYPNSKKRRGRVQGGGNISPTLTTSPNIYRIEENIPMSKVRYRIRKLTPKECYRLMGIHDDDFEKAQKVASNSRLYMTAGNGICVPVLMALFSQLGIDGIPKWNDLSTEEKYEILGNPKKN